MRGGLRRDGPPTAMAWHAGYRPTSPWPRQGLRVAATHHQMRCEPADGRLALAIRVRASSFCCLQRPRWKPRDSHISVVLSVPMGGR